MTERAYTVTEIDALRHVVENKILWGRYSGPRPPTITDFRSSSSAVSNAFRTDELSVLVEQRVRTHMLAGHVAADLLDSETQR